MRRRGKGMSTVTVGVVGLILAALAAYFGFTKAIPFRSHYEVKAAFNSANNLRPNSPVRIAGVEVGKVVKVERSRKGGNGAMVTMRVNDKGRPLHEDATFKIRPRIFLEGNFFVDVTPGTGAGGEVARNHVFPVNQTATPVQLDELLTALQSDTRKDLQTLLREYAKGLSGRGAKGYNASIPYMKPAYRDTAIVSDAMHGQNEHDLSGYIDKAGVVAAALDRNRPQLKAFITDFNTTAAALAREDDNLEAAIHELPRTLGVARPALGALNDAFPGLRGFARDLRPGVRSSGPTIDVALPLVRQLRRLVSERELRGLTRDLRPAVPALARFTKENVPLSQQLRELSSCQNEVVLPWFQDKIEDQKFPAEGKVFEEAPKALEGLAGESRSGDANGQWFRVLVAGGTNIVQQAPGQFAITALPILGANPPKPQGRPPLRSDIACETQEPPDLRTRVGAPPPQRTFDTNSAAYTERLAKAQAYATGWLQQQLKAEGLDGQLKVGEQPATKELIQRSARVGGTP